MSGPAATATGPQQPLPMATAGTTLTRASSSSGRRPSTSSEEPCPDGEKPQQIISNSTADILTKINSTPSPDLDVVAAGRLKAQHSFNPLRRWRSIPPVPSAPSTSLEANASVFSQITFTWISPFMHVGFLRPLTQPDIPLVPPFRESATLSTRLQESFDRRLSKGEKQPLLWALNETFFREFWLSGVSRLCADIFLVMTPFTLKYLIQFATNAYVAQHTPEAKVPPVGHGVGMAVGIAVMQGIASVAMGQFVYRGMMSGGQMRAALIGMIFKKSLRISARATARGGMSLGESEGNDENQKKKKKKANQDTLSPAEGWTNGHITNLMSIDTYHIDSVCAWFHLIWTCPITIILTLTILLINISYSALAGFALLILSVPTLGKVMRVLTARRRLMNKITDKRVGLTQEILLGVCFVKYYAWEESFLAQLKKLRSEEIKSVQFLLGVRAGVTAVGLSMPVFGAMLAFITYSLTGNTLNPANIFSSLALFNTLRLPLNFLPVVIGQIADAWVSVQRIETFLKAEEVQDNREMQDMSDGIAVRILDGEFTWEKSPENAPNSKGTAGASGVPLLKSEIKAAKKAAKEEKKAAKKGPGGSGGPGTLVEEDEKSSEPFKLQNINLAFQQDELVAVVGAVASGKTSLLAAIVGEMRQSHGVIRQASRLAYCPQYAWIQNASVRENIVFGRDFDPEWYQKVVYACALQPDLDMLPDGDATEIGERGITVSGGQKQRINIARAIYFDAGIVLMDDPLSAVDAHVGRHLFDEAICGLLKGKCRILATHQLHVLDRCDRVIWMDDGAVKAVGTYQELMEAEEGFRTLVGEYGREKEEAEGGEDEDKGRTRKDTSGSEDNINNDVDTPTTTTPSTTSADISRIPSRKNVPPAAAGPPGRPSKLMQTEERSTSSVGWKVYKAYILASGTFLSAPGIMLMLLLSQGANLMTTLWLSFWTSGKFGLSNGTYIGVFAGLGAAQSALMFAFAFWLTIAGTTSSKTLMAQAMERVLRAPMSFFDTTPIGRIINRFSKDVDVMDNNLTDAIRMYFFTLAMISSVCILVIAYFPYFAIALFPLIVLFFMAASYYRSSAREIKRHEAVLRSIVYAKFSEALTGISTIRAYGLQSRFTSELHTAIDAMDSAYFITFANHRWLSLRLDTIGNLLVFTTAILVVTSRFSVSPAISGVVLSCILQIAMMIQWMIRQLAEVENAMNATERVHYYGTELPSEAPLYTNATVHLRPTWPETGKIDFQSVSMRYRPSLPLVLNGIDLSIAGGERIGVVGRTGAGKSSMMSALFRLVELSSGKILIDGTDIHTLGLHDLRKKLAIIPQDPTLFRGTVRSNLDPFEEHTDAELWDALRKSYLVDDAPPPEIANGETTPTSVTQQQSITLSTPVLDAGENFSLGQRQLMALARALVRNSRIIICDEATSSVDQETDRKIQRTMREGFAGRTVLCIAHRLGTVLGYDRVVVMDRGKVVEMGGPKELWERGGVWRGMCEKGGVKEEDFEVKGGWVGEENALE
ncbi:P-loop containing nucleoside triphosphate hydrolase protein [Tirmania nivea]|nr:P-loop containing nucleoside triphosphate hydrolase protein [Tirmania nivea]